MAIGDYSKTTYVNGSTPAINAVNLNNNENKVQEIDDDLVSGAALTLEANCKKIFALGLITGF